MKERPPAVHPRAPAAKSCCGAVAPRIISLPPPPREHSPKTENPRTSSNSPATAGIGNNARKETPAPGRRWLSMPPESPSQTPASARSTAERAVKDFDAWRKPPPSLSCSASPMFTPVQILTSFKGCAADTVCNKAANGRVNFFTDTSSSKRVIGCDVFPDLRDILGCERMKDKTLVTAHLDERSFNKSSSRVPWWPYPAFRQRITRPGYCTLGFPNASVRTAPWKSLSGLPTTGIAGPRSFTIGQRTRLH